MHKLLLLGSSNFIAFHQTHYSELIVSALDYIQYLLQRFFKDPQSPGLCHSTSVLLWIKEKSLTNNKNYTVLLQKPKAFNLKRALPISYLMSYHSWSTSVIMKHSIDKSMHFFSNNSLIISLNQYEIRVPVI